MTKLRPLVMMQLKEKIDFSFLKTKKSAIRKIVLSILGFVAITAVVYLLFYASNFLGLFSVTNIIPSNVLVVVFTIMMFLSIISCTYGLMKNLYFSRDNMVLLTYPVNPNTVFFSKLIVFYIYELIKNLNFMIPVFIAFGLINGQPIYYYLWMLFGFVFISAIPVVIGAFLSIPCMWIVTFLKQRKYLQIILAAVVAGLVIYALVRIIGLIPANLDILGSWGVISSGIQDFLANFARIFYPFTEAVIMLVGRWHNLRPVIFSLETLWVFLSIIGVIGLFLGLCFLLSRPLFFKMASKPFEFKTKPAKPKQNVPHKKFASALKKEFLVNFRSADSLYGNIAILAIMPIAIFLLNKIFASMNTRLLGQVMTMSFDILIMLLIVLASNSRIASIFSSEGQAAYLMKTAPATYHKSLSAKLVFNAILMITSIFITSIIFYFTNGHSVLGSFMLFFTVLFTYIGHMLWSAELDIMNPQYEQYASTGSHIKNPNENKSIIYCFMLAFIFFAVSLFLFTENVTAAWIKIAVIALAFMLFRAYLYYNKIKVYYRED